ncbi:MAG TPA: sigma-70 family RNA polymerase sigma factor [Gemmataceae bacterium]|jgi:RNA polymerase sigma factor (sigma-70 family)|nr:sigma-70 family RNA polymerase sigma factor [Gemmataceae bacterium]
MKSKMPSVLNSRTIVVALLVGSAMAVHGATASAGETYDKAITDINRYCSACWRNARLPADAWDDCTQEVFSRLLQRLPAQSWSKVLQADGEERREFIRAIDAVKKRTQRSRKWSSLESEVADRSQIFQSGVTEQREVLDRASDEVLSSRQKRILRMSMEGDSVQEMASALRMSPERVSDEKYKAIRKLRSHLGVDA